MKPFSKHTRQQWLETIEDKRYDLIVVGGGITGAGILLDATSRGMKTLLIEMQDFAGGTSSRSTKLIHGGIRYLKQGDFKLVAEVGKERATVRNLARHLVHPLPIMIPIYKGGSMKKWQLRIGMWIFEYLVKIQDRFLSKAYNAKETSKREPSLTTEGLLGGIKYYENRTDDARLTVELIKTAVEKGAKAINYTKVEEFTYDNSGTINGVVIKDQIDETTKTITSQQVVSATGPWVDDVRERDDLQAEDKLVLTKGIHLVFKKEDFPINSAIYFDTHDKRMVFAVPLEDVTYIGTTDTFYKGDPKYPDVTKEDIDYVIKTINQKFPKLGLTNDHIYSSWSGLRPLINEPGKKPSEISRKDEIFESDSGLISIAGGKLTGYRKMAKKAVDLVAKKLNITTETDTSIIKVVGGQFKNEEDFRSQERESIRRGIEAGLSEKEASWLFSKFGSETTKVLEQNLMQSELPKHIALAYQYAQDFEMVMKDEDFYTRRAGFSFFHPENAKYFEKH